MISNLLPSTIEAKDTNLLLSDRCNDLRYQIKALHFLDMWLLHNKPWFRNLYWKSCVGIYLHEEICSVKFAEFIYIFCVWYFPKAGDVKIMVETIQVVFWIVEYKLLCAGRKYLSVVTQISHFFLFSECRLYKMFSTYDLSVQMPKTYWMQYGSMYSTFNTS